MVRSVLLAVVVAVLLPGAALADTVTTGPARPGADTSSARLHISVTPSCTISPDYGAEWQRVSGGPLTRIGTDAPSGGQPFEGDVNATGLVSGGVYRYRAYGSTYCQDGTYQPTTYGAYLCFMAGRTQADGTLNVDCATPESTGGGGSAGGGGGATAPPVAPGSGTVGGVDGAVCYQAPGSNRCLRLQAGGSIPVGSVVDTRLGTITLVVADGKGGTYTGQFSGGVFAFTQQVKEARLITNLKLVGGNFGVCNSRGAAASLGDWPGSFADSARRRVVRYLKARAHGAFNVIGKRASGIERGTTWKTTDTCDATEIKVITGTVLVRDRVKRKTFVVKAPHTYRATGTVRR